MTASNSGGDGVQGDSGGDYTTGVRGISRGFHGYGVFGEARGSQGTGVVGTASAGGRAGYFGGDVMIEAGQLLCSGCIDSATFAPTAKAPDADKLDGLDSTQIVTGAGRLIANRLAGATAGQVLLNIPFMGQLSVVSCDGTSGRIRFDTLGTGNVDYMHAATFDSGPEVFSTIAGVITTGSHPLAAITMNIARDTGPATKIVTIWVSWNGNGCRFQAQALQSPQL